MSEYEVKERLFELVMKFIENNRITCVEAIHQCDWVIENAYSFIEDLYEAAYPLLEEDEE